MTLLAVVALVCGTVLLLGRGAAACLTAKWDADRARLMTVDTDHLTLESRRLAIAEREMALKEHQAKLEAERPVEQPMPPELVDRILAWEDEFAQESERKTILGLYAELRDWAAVKQRLPALTPVVMTDHIAAPREAFA